MPTPAVIEATNVTKIIGPAPQVTRVLTNISLTIPAGQLTAIMGPAGAGKTTLMHLLGALQVPSAGSILLDGQEIVGLPEEQLTTVRRRVGFVFPTPQLLPPLSVTQNLTLTCELAGRSLDAGWFARVVDTLGLAAVLPRPVPDLPPALAQRVAIGRALMHQPLVIFADEPTSILDRRASAEILALLRTTVRELGQTVVLMTNEATAAAHADSVLLLADGQIVGQVDRPTIESVRTGIDALVLGAYL
ncbi:ABC transporter ATP-binding protein [Buchananella hordeovulneris]|uniref:ABC transporter ATP-binding protein n=1 Tax=Buchananella hordeovulneris TaxID=52770 RepID=UPI0026DD02A1|nr:ABC transporter ATP-binding protein [Buchananella hordeovulneris]MDO5079836.1 ABC transporter ATP-binding protein [Buchananella hordeovulneris]